jgi:biopolymer transport protein ExbD
MTQIDPGANQISLKRKRRDVRGMTRHMTPMVDLGFLLITFFVITAELSKPRAMDLIMPRYGEATPTEASKSLTILIGGNEQLFYYFGPEEDAIRNDLVIAVSWNRKTGIAKIIQDKQSEMDKHPEGRGRLVVLIKPGKQSTYKNLVDVLDEMLILGVKRYAVVQPGEWDLQFLEQKPHYLFQ